MGSLTSSGRVFLAVLFVCTSARPLLGQGKSAENHSFPKQALQRTLSSFREREKLEAIETLRECGDDPRVAELLVEVLKKRRSSSTSPQSAIQMILLLGQFPKDKDVLFLLAQLIKSENEKLVMAAVDALAEIQDPRSLDAIMRLTESPSYERVYGFRKCVVQAVMRFEDPRSVVFAIKQLPDRTGQLEFDIVRYLSHVSAQRFVTNTENWKTWFRDNHTDFDFSETPDAFTLDANVPEDFVWTKDVARFFDIYIYAKRLVFVLDSSSSMLRDVGTESRFDRAKKELTSAIRDLPTDAHFNVVMYNTVIATWNKLLLPATPENKGRALEWIEERDTGKGTASFDALDHSFGIDGNTEAVLFLSDGKPSKGRITDPEEIVQTVTQENFFRRIAIYSVGVGVTAETETMMKDLAEKNSGLYMPVR